MKLAELLLERSALQRRIESLRGRIVGNAVAQDGSAAHEDPRALLEEVMRSNQTLRETIVAINCANLAARTAEGQTLTEAIAMRDELAAQHAILKATAEAAVRSPDRYSSRELAYVSQFDVGELHTRADKVAQKIRHLNAQIQQANWNNEV